MGEKPKRPLFRPVRPADAPERPPRRERRPSRPVLTGRCCMLDEILAGISFSGG